MHRYKQKPKCSCIFCAKEFFTYMIDQHQKNCKWMYNIINKKWKIYDDYVICPICGAKLLEINNAHLKSHNLTVVEFDEKYTNSSRLSKNTRENKKTFSGRTHTQEYKKYMSDKMMGKYKGKKLSKEHKLKIGKQSQKMWKDNYGVLKKSRTKIGYIEKYGEEIGLKRWYQKNYKNSCSSMFVTDKKLYELYKERVHFFTNISLEKFNIEYVDKLFLKGRKFHLDHKYPMAMGFNNNILPFILGSPHNLQVVTRSYNCSKQHLYSDILIDELIKLTYKNKQYINSISDIMGYINELRNNRKFWSE